MNFLLSRHTDIDISGAEAFQSLKQWRADQQIALAFSRPRAVITERMCTLGLYDDEPLHPANRAALDALTAKANVSLSMLSVGAR